MFIYCNNYRTKCHFNFSISIHVYDLKNSSFNCNRRNLTIFWKSCIACFTLIDPPLSLFFFIYQQVTMTPEHTQRQHFTTPFPGIQSLFQRLRRQNDQNLEPDRKSMSGTRRNIFEDSFLFNYDWLWISPDFNCVHVCIWM